MSQKKKSGNRLRALREYGVNLIALSILTGLFAGAVVTLYNILTGIAEEKSVELYRLIASNPAFVPLLFVGPRAAPAAAAPAGSSAPPGR